MTTLSELKEDILKDGVIDADEAARLEKALYADGAIDKEEAELMFELNNAVSGKENDPAWDNLFIKVISDFLMNDDQSEGHIDEQEARWLHAKLVSDGQIDDLERKLLTHLQERSANFPEIFKLLLNNTF